MTFQGMVAASCAEASPRPMPFFQLFIEPLVWEFLAIFFSIVQLGLLMGCPNLKHLET